MLILALGFGTFLPGCTDADPASSNLTGEPAQSLAKADAVEGPGGGARGDVSATEREHLVFMREEEKLARDVYTVMYQKWASRIFLNISASEQTHMNAILTLLNRYGIEDPVGENGAGRFTDPELKALYDELVARGNTSLEEALRVGAAIEELDIADLRDAISVTDNGDILRVYGNLLRGSQNHLRAFTRALSVL